MRNNSKLITRLAVITAIALIAFMVESLLPPMFFLVPGTKLGLSGMFITLVIALYGWRHAVVVLIIKCVVSAMFTGNVFMLYYSLPAGGAALIVGSLLIRFFINRMSIITVSALSALMHNTVQIIMAAILFNNAGFLYYISAAALAGVIAGSITGLCLYYIVRTLPKNAFYG